MQLHWFAARGIAVKEMAITLPVLEGVMCFNKTERLELVQLVN
jgi:hypothetical protein